MNKIKIISLCIVSVLLVGCGTSKNRSNSVDQKQNIEQEQKKIKLDKENAINIEYNDKNYADIFDEFKKQEIKAKDKYIDKTIKVTGEVTKIEKKNKNIVVTLSSNNRYHDAHLYLQDNEENEEKLANVKVADATKGALKEGQGDIITAYGIFDEFVKAEAGSKYIKLINSEF